LSGKHEIIDSLHVNWTVGYANSVTDEPDFKNYQFTGTSPVTSDSLPIPSDVEYFNFLPVGSIISTTSPARYYGKTGETTRSAAIDFEYAPKVSTISWLKPKFRAGYYYEFKQRESFTRTLGYTITGQGTSFNLVSVDVDSVFLPENFNAGENGLLISEGSFIAPNYSAENRYNAGYVAASLPIGKKISIYGGIRVEHNIRKLGIKPLAESDFPFVEDTVFRLPSLNITYRLTKKHVLRFAYSETVNRPEFREASASSWYENIANPKIVISGNNTLKTASADNYDFRYEYYPQSGETFSFGAFYKQFTNPIEQVFTSASGVPSGTIVNTAGAYSYGMELELLQSCRNWFKKRNFFSDFAININAAYIRSQISVGDTLLVLDQYTDQRPLFGQAPYILNTSLYYQNDSLGLKVNLAYNITGPRIFRGGTSDGIPDIYEMPVHMFDLTITQRINKYMDCRFGIQNLLDAEFLFLQYYTEDRKIPAFKKEGDAVSYYNRFRTGRYYTLSLTFKF
jgi:TonB-dependent receptor